MATQRQRRADDDRAYARFRIAYLHGHPWCQAGEAIRLVDPGHECRRRATDVHHRRLVGQQGHRTLPENVRAVCWICHHWIHHNVAKACELGFLVQSSSPEYQRLGRDTTPRSAP